MGVAQTWLRNRICVPPRVGFTRVPILPAASSEFVSSEHESPILRPQKEHLHLTRSSGQLFWRTPRRTLVCEVTSRREGCGNPKSKVQLTVSTFHALLLVAHLCETPSVILRYLPKKDCASGPPVRLAHSLLQMPSFQQLAASCSLLALFFALPFFVFSSLQPLLAKTGGVGWGRS
jgi:hypothetical protein